MGHLAFFGFLQSLHTYKVHTIGIFESIETGLLTVLPVSSEACLFACLDDWCFMATCFHVCILFLRLIARVPKIRVWIGYFQKSIRLKGRLKAKNRPLVQQSLYDISFTQDQGHDRDFWLIVPKCLMIPPWIWWKKPRFSLMSKKVICHVIFVSFIFLPSCIWNLGATCCRGLMVREVWCYSWQGCRDAHTLGISTRFRRLVGKSWPFRGTNVRFNIRFRILRVWVFYSRLGIVMQRADIFRGWEPFIKVLLNNYFLQQTCIVWVQEVASNRFAHPNLSHMKMPKLAAWSNRGGKRVWEAKRERRGLCWLKRFLCGRTCGWLACEMSGIVQVWLSHAAGRLSLLCIYLQPISRICDWNWKMQQVSGWKSKGHFAFPSL